MEPARAWLRRHRWVGDVAPAVVLVVGSVNFVASHPAVLPATLALAAAVAGRRRWLMPACAVALAIAAAQVIAGIGRYTGNPLQLTFADTGILVLLYTVADRRPRRVSLWGLAAGVALFAATVAQLKPGPQAGQHPLQFVLLTIPFYVLAPVSAWVLGESMARRRVYLAALEERAARAEAERDARARHQGNLSSWRTATGAHPDHLRPR